MKKLIATSIAAMFMSGCATIFDGGNQPVTIKSIPDTATISISNRSGEKIHSGTTPATVTLKRGAGYFKSEIYTIKVDKPGYQSKEVTITGSINGWYIANLLFGGVIGLLIVDPISGAMYNLSPESVTATLESMNVNTSKSDGSLTVVLAQDLPVDAWKHAHLISTTN